MRLLVFSALIVLLWSPVLIPVLPSLLHQWATKSPGGVVGAASVVDLYRAILILVTIWGRRVRGFSKPLVHYGLRFWSKRKQIGALVLSKVVLGYSYLPLQK